MPDTSTNPSTENITEPAQEKLVDLRPTLFIGMGGTGMEVLLRMRRRILNTLWGNVGSKVRIDGLTDFPLAQFIQFDLDSGAVIDSGKAQADDLQFDAIKFTEDEKIVESFNMTKYSRDNDTLDKFKDIKEWLPLTPTKIRALGIETNKGAGQIRSVSRLYFFDKYTKVRDKIRLKLKTLKSGLSHEQALSKLGLKMELSNYRVVVVASVAGGTGSGSFLDMGWLARWLAGGAADVELMLFLPTGYSSANKDRTEGNGYAALMELESAMRGNNDYVGKWDQHDNPELEAAPYTQVYLIDSGNVANQHTKNIQDVYHMLADTLFEDFASGDFANKKRSVAVNQAQHKNFLYDALVPQDRFGAMRLSYSKLYSSLGQSVLDTRQELRRDMRSHLWAAEMLKAFFGVGETGVSAANNADNIKRNKFLSEFVGLGEVTFKDFPLFSDKSIKLEYSNGEFTDYQIVKELLNDSNGSLLGNVENEVNKRINGIKVAPLEQRPNQIRIALQEMERDAVRNQDSTADAIEDRITKVRRDVLNKYKTLIKNQLYKYLDDKELGGLSYVLSLVEQIKDRIDSRSDGIIVSLQTNAKRYREIKEAVKTREFERLVNSLEETKGFSLFNSKENQSQTVLAHLSKEITNIINFHLYAKAADEATKYLSELSSWLGNKTGVDKQGVALWNGLVGEFLVGREAVIGMIKTLERSSAILQSDVKKEHATLIYVPTPEQETPIPKPSQMREWADEAFSDFGGSKQVFEMLAESAKKGKILSKVKKMAERQLLDSQYLGETTTEVDPLIKALKEMTDVNRAELFKKWIACSMPWVDADFTGDFALKADQYKCFIGVSDDALFKTEFGEELNACVPTVAGITSAQVSIVTMGVIGRAVCYTELSGIPLTTLRAIESWRTSYRKELTKSPLHTHINSTQFTHPIAPSTGELTRLAEDFKLYLLAVMTGIFIRSSEETVPAGIYKFKYENNEIVQIGNERMVRQNGLPSFYKNEILRNVKEIINSANGPFLAVISTLAWYYQKHVYTPILEKDENGTEVPRKGFAWAMASEIYTELRESAKRKNLSETEVNQIRDKLLDPSLLKLWAEPILDSNLDAYKHEVSGHKLYEEPRLKLVIKPELIRNLLSQPPTISQILDRFNTNQDLLSKNATNLLSSNGNYSNNGLDTTTIELEKNETPDYVVQLEKINNMREKGALTDDEFKNLKAKIMSKLMS